MVSLRGWAVCAWAMVLTTGTCAKPAAVNHGDAANDLPVAAPPDPFSPRRLSDPPRTVAERPFGTTLAVLTDGARTVVLVGPQRRFEEPTAKNAVVTTAWVRALPAPFSGALDDKTTAWLDAALVDPSPDLLALAMEYIDDAPPILDAKKVQIAGDADYGPLTDLGTREEGADFNDYLGLPWTFSDGMLDRPHGDMLHSLDCSGYMRMLWGYRNGVPLAPGPVTAGQALPRRAVQMDASSPGIVIISNQQAPPMTMDQLQPGDLVFFDADPTDGPAIDHVGMFLDKDEAGHYRFISSRKNANGPTLGDDHGASLLDGTGLYAQSFRSARRL
jgi:hypothetical protein